MIEKTSEVTPIEDSPEWLMKGRAVNSDNVAALAREALLLNENAYEIVRDGERPGRRGLVIIGWIIAMVAVSLLIGYVLGLLTTPRFDLLSSELLNRIVASNWYAGQSAANPQFGTQFNAAYVAVWELLRLVGGYPSVTGMVSSALGFAGATFFGWLTMGMVTHLVARWLGGEAKLRQFLGVLALAYAPLLLRVLEIIPGLTIPATLIFLLLIVTRFQAIKRTYRLSPGYALAALAGAYLLLLLIVAVAGLLIIAFGLNQIPYLDPILRFLRLYSGMQ